MKAGITTTGASAVDSMFAQLADPETVKAIAMSAGYAGLGVLAKACRDAAPGSIKKEVGMFVRVSGNRVWGRVGLMKFPRPGDGQNGPHGVYLDQGTKFIAARHFIGNAISSAMPAARNAMQRAVQRKIKKLAEANA